MSVFEPNRPDGPDVGAGEAVRAARSAMPERAPGEPLFIAPWHARAFALVVSLVQDGRLDWPTFQRQRIAALAASGAGRGATREAIDEAWFEAWFEAWLAAAERVIDEEGIAAPADVDERVDAIREAVAAVRDSQRTGVPEARAAARIDA